MDTMRPQLTGLSHDRTVGTIRIMAKRRRVSRHSDQSQFFFFLPDLKNQKRMLPQSQAGHPAGCCCYSRVRPASSSMLPQRSQVRQLVEKIERGFAETKLTVKPNFQKPKL